MVNIPTNVIELMNKEGTVKALVTSSKKGMPHAIIAGTIMSPAPNTMVIGEVLMKVSSKNLKENEEAAFLITSGTEAYEINCKVKARLDKGPELDGMNKVLETMHMHAAAIWIFTVEAVFDQSASPKAGTKLA